VGHPGDMNAMTKGCLGGTGVCFISHEGEVFPCGSSPTPAGDLRKQTSADVWANSTVFGQLREDDNLKGTCGCCEFQHVCMGCRTRAFAPTRDFLAEELFWVYQLGTATKMIEEIAETRR
jgi:radical SAM protein with 4Fe4S-binding SPASM domain